VRYSSREKCLRLVADRSLDKSYSSRSKALFHSNGDAGLISDESPRLEGTEAVFRSMGKRDIPIKGSSGRSHGNGFLPLPCHCVNTRLAWADSNRRPAFRKQLPYPSGPQADQRRGPGSNRQRWLCRPSPAPARTASWHPRPDSNGQPRGPEPRVLSPAPRGLGPRGSVQRGRNRTSRPKLQGYGPLSSPPAQLTVGCLAGVEPAL
jgi:hypothetical protein